MALSEETSLLFERDLRPWSAVPVDAFHVIAHCPRWDRPWRLLHFRHGVDRAVSVTAAGISGERQVCFRRFQREVGRCRGAAPWTRR
jgi:hypothetical protein